ncbi:MAG: LysM peptidoglycan-binding domain-containing protein [Victivallales bacterium]|nr:LysM peptidoglycan-binding domain-containing protein [Victivallales bacterium]
MRFLFNKIRFTAFVIILFFSFVSINAAQYSTRSIYTVLKGHDEQLKTISARVNMLQDNYVKLIKNVNLLEKQLRTEKRRNARLQKKIESLEIQLASDRKQIQANLDQVINKVSEETSRAIKDMAERKAASDKKFESGNGNSPRGTGNFDEYIVQPGATLSAISKAYGVSVNDIKKANGLTGDIIRVGEKLYIPQ